MSVEDNRWASCWGTAPMPAFGTTILPWDIAPHVKSANERRSEREGSSVMPANSEVRTRCVEGPNRRCCKPSEMVGEGRSSGRSKSFDVVPKRHLRKRSPSPTPTERSVGSKYFGDRSASPSNLRLPVFGLSVTVQLSIGFASSSAMLIQR